MLALGPLAFVAPWLLVALGSLPILWWLLRAVPPSPRRIAFPAIRLLFGLQRTEETPHRTPWWLLLLRLLIAALLIVGLAHPIINPGTRLQGSGPLLLIVDNGWAAAKRWDVRRETMLERIDAAERDGKLVAIVPTAAETVRSGLASSTLMRPADARRLAQNLQPKPWPTDRLAALETLDTTQFDGSVNVIWMSDGLDAGNATTVADRLQRLGSLTVLRDDALTQPLLLETVTSDGSAGAAVTARRANAAGASGATVTALREDGRIVASEPLSFAAGEPTAIAQFTLPGELRNEIARFVIDRESSAGGVFLVDEGFRRRPVGLVSGEAVDVDQPLLGDIYYLERALLPFTDVRSGDLETLLRRDLSVLVLADIGQLTDAELNRLTAWVEAGGMLVRFAGPRLADGGAELLPVALRRGGRIFGGVMTWEQPARLAAFESGSPFEGIPIPADVIIGQQVLAEPTPDLSDKTWARLEDGTPLVTGDRRGDGWVVLVHTTANASWSNLALSGLYVDMLRRLVALSQGVETQERTDRPVPAYRLLDGFGRLGEPNAAAVTIAASELDAAAIGPDLQPGFYGTETSRRALNLGDIGVELTAIDDLPAGVPMSEYGPATQVDLRPWLLTAALLLLLADFVISLGLRGLLRRPAVATASLVLLIAVGDRPALAQVDDEFALAATLQTRLAYVLTDDTRVNEISRAGLTGLTDTLRARTSVEPGEPVGIDVESDELAFFPLIYWPLIETEPAPSDGTVVRLNEYLRNGGTILFDTRDQQLAIGGSRPGNAILQRVVGALDVPPLTQVPPDHVLTKSFYLMQDFPGRWAGGNLWVQQPDSRINDGVSPIIIGANDYASAWARDQFGRAMFPAVPGGERQREMAFRFGVNLVMYALTGNYKADQVHVPAILERLGQ